MIQGSEESKKKAALILEVLSGLKTITEACAILGIKGIRYYLLEGRAMQGMVSAMENLPKGRRERPIEDQLKRTEKDRDRLARELRQTQVLLRMVRRSYGVTEPVEKPGTKVRRRRRQGKLRVAQVLARLQMTGPTPTPKTTPAPVGMSKGNPVE